MAEKWCVSDYKTFTSTFQWTVKKFHARCANRSDLESPVFTSGPGDRYKWKLKIDPGYDISLYLVLVSQPPNVINTASVKMAIIANGKECLQLQKQPESITSGS